MDAREQAARILREKFGFPGFLPGQEAAIHAILEGRDVLVVMPTGGGKSLCYQLPALVLEGLTVVVSPLIALMKDQVDALTARGVPATAINSTLSESEMDDRISGMARGAYRLVYIAPERFRSERFVRTLAPLSIALFALDEAHCISQWGHDFRPDYLRMRGALEELGRPPVAALTATATPDVRRDIATQLGLGSGGRAAPAVFVSGFARPNLVLSVRQVGGREDKRARLFHAVERLGSGIVYCATRKNVERVAGDLGELGVEAIAYHAGMPDTERRAAQDRFASSPRPVVVATNAFGMGIDRPDLRFVFHHDIPGSLEAYYQEAGRAGRDGREAFCDLLFNYADVRTQQFFLDGANPPPDVVRGVYAALVSACAKAPAEIDAATIADRFPGRVNGMAVSTSIVLLERAGLVRRTYRGERGDAAFDLPLPPVPPRSLPIDFEALARKRHRDELRLACMVRYATDRRCRHACILDYFGDESPRARCAACDHCRAASRFPLGGPERTPWAQTSRPASAAARPADRPAAAPRPPPVASPAPACAPAARAEADPEPFDEAVFAALRDWRRRKAAGMGGVPAYVVYTDRTLRELARALPRDTPSLAAIRGIGPAKLAGFGEETLEVIRRTRPAGA